MLRETNDEMCMQARNLNQSRTMKRKNDDEEKENQRPENKFRRPVISALKGHEKSVPLTTCEPTTLGVSGGNDTSRPQRSICIDQNQACSPCNHNGDKITATVYCDNCLEHLCSNCEKSHRGLKLTRSHVLWAVRDVSFDVNHETLTFTGEEGTSGRASSVNRPDYINQQLCESCDCNGKHNKANPQCSLYKEPTPEYCKAHETEVVKYYCEDHKRLICQLCQDVSHQHCDKTLLPGLIHYINRCDEIVENITSNHVAITTGIKKEQDELVKVIDAANKSNFLEMKISKDNKIEVNLKTERIGMISCSTFLRNGDLILYDIHGRSFILYDNSFSWKSTLNVDMDFINVGVFSNDMCRTSDTMVAVTSSSSKIIQFIIAESTLTLGKSFSVDKPCYGIDSHLELLYVVCENLTTYKREIVIMKEEGQIQSRYELNNEGGFSFICPHRVRVSNTSGRMYIADKLAHTITCLTQNGDVVYKYKHADLREPSDIVVDDEDNIIVCGFESNSVHLIDCNGNHKSVLVSKSDWVDSPWYLSYRNTDGALVVGLNRKSSFMVHFFRK